MELRFLPFLITHFTETSKIQRTLSVQILQDGLNVGDNIDGGGDAMHYVYRINNTTLPLQ